MNRTQLIFELAKHCHQDWFKSIMSWETKHLEALLAYYQKGEPKVHRKSTIIVVEVGIDWAEGKDRTVEFQWPFGYAHVDREPLKNKQRFSDMRKKK